MGDHRFSFKAEFEMHGVKDTLDLGWHNWDAGPHGIDSRITGWLEAAVSKAFAKYDANVSAYFDEQNKAQREKDERTELERLKAKYGG
jgi:hypothetical protein